MRRAETHGLGSLATERCVPRQRLTLLRRDFQALVDYGGAAVWVGKVGLALIDRLFHHWHRVHADPEAWQGFAEEIRLLQEEFRALLEVGVQNRVDKAAGLCRALLKLWPALWTFVTVPGVEPTNNAAERALRPAVLWRKGCFGSQSDEGERFVAWMLSVAATCRQQGRSPLEYLTEVCTAAQRDHPIPSLLAAPASAQGGVNGYSLRSWKSSLAARWPFKNRPPAICKRCYHKHVWPQRPAAKRARLRAEEGSSEAVE